MNVYVESHNLKLLVYFILVPVSEEESGIENAAPTFLKTLERINAKESEYVVLECKIVGEPMPEIKWFKVGICIKINLVCSYATLRFQHFLPAK